MPPRSGAVVDVVDVVGVATDDGATVVEEPSDASTADAAVVVEPSPAVQDATAHPITAATTTPVNS